MRETDAASAELAHPIGETFEVTGVVREDPLDGGLVLAVETYRPADQAHRTAGPGQDPARDGGGERRSSAPPTPL